MKIDLNSHTKPVLSNIYNIFFCFILMSCGKIALLSRYRLTYGRVKIKTFDFIFFVNIESFIEVLKIMKNAKWFLLPLIKQTIGFQ